MPFRPANLVHTDEAALVESTATMMENGSNEPGTRSSAGEHSLHTRRVAGSIPAASTILALHRLSPAGGPDECWPWQRARLPAGYGKLVIGGRHLYAHRASFEAYHRPLLPGEQVCHRCDNPPCWNPAHLFGGSQADNIQDAVAKGRHAANFPVGERHHSARLTRENVLAIRASTESGSSLARAFGVTPTAIYKILDGRSWKHAK